MLKFAKFNYLYLLAMLSLEKRFNYLYLLSMPFLGKKHFQATLHNLAKAYWGLTTELDAANIGKCL